MKTMYFVGNIHWK